MTISYRDGCAGKICSTCKEWKPVTLFSARPKLSRDGYNSQCKACVAAKVRRYTQRNPEKRKELNRAYHQANRERLNERARLRNKQKREEIRIYRKGRKEQERAGYRRWLAKNPDYHRRWYALNPAKVKAKYHRRQTNKRNGGISFTAAEWERLKQMYNYTCLRCKQQEPSIVLSAYPNNWYTAGYEHRDNGKAHTRSYPEQQDDNRLPCF